MGRSRQPAVGAGRRSQSRPTPPLMVVAEAAGTQGSLQKCVFCFPQTRGTQCLPTSVSVKWIMGGNYAGHFCAWPTEASRTSSSIPQLTERTRKSPGMAELRVEGAWVPE